MICWQSIGHFLKKLHPPGSCMLCQQSHAGRWAVCRDCLNRLSQINNGCQRCAHPLPDQYPGLCGQCIQSPPAFDRVRVHYLFQEPLRQLIHRYKYQQQLILGPVLAQLIQASLTDLETKPDCLIPVPLHPKRLRERGFNQAAYLAGFVGKALQIPVNWRACKKIINTEPQAELDKTERAENLKNAFLLKPVKAQRVALIDDILTTGQTANQLAKLLKSQGVGQVDVWCCARAVMHDS
jgi:ComF family protein